MIFRPPVIYPLTDRKLTGLTHAEQVSRLADGGARLVQLRDKNFSSGELYDAAAEAMHVARRRGVLLIINDRVDVALACGADGVHLGQDDMPVEAARSLLGEHAVIGVSTHTPEQGRRAARLPVSYIAIGPVFDTKTKADPEAVVGLDGVRQARALVPAHIPLVAIGGITSENARAVLDAGADSLALVAALLSAPDCVAERTGELLARLG